MSNNPTLTWNTFLIHATGLARRMKLLGAAMTADPALADEYDDLAGEYEEEPAELSDIIRGVVTVLKVIGETPNAFINCAGMAALHGEVERAEIIERAVKPLLEKVDPVIW